MKRILAISTLAISTCVGFSTTAGAVDATSTHSGKNPATCAIGALNGVLSPVENIITDVGDFSGNFPKVLSSAGSPGKFVTLCNTPLATLKITPGVVTVPPGQVDHTTTYTLSGSSTVYPTLSATYTAPDIATDTAVAHGISDTASEVTVSAAITAGDNKVLVGSNAANSYSVPLTATLTAN